jgi:hypothetical protein
VVSRVKQGLEELGFTSSPFDPCSFFFEAKIRRPKGSLEFMWMMVYAVVLKSFTKS